MYAFHSTDMMVDSVMAPAHGGVEGNKAFDILAKQSLKSQMVDMRVL